MSYAPVPLPFEVRRLPDGSLLAVAESGDHAFLTDDELSLLRHEPASLPLERQAELRALFLLGSAQGNIGTRQLLTSRQAAKRETVQGGPALHIIVPTLQCAHSCRYCQVSRALDDAGHTISLRDLEAACDTVFESPASALTVEFQGGDPLLRFDLVQHAIRRIANHNKSERRRVRFVVASTLHQLDEEMCALFKEYNVFLSTSIDGPAWLHNRNRPTPSRDSHQRTTVGIDLARRCVGAQSVAALMTTTRQSLGHADEIVDEYVRLGFKDIFLRPLSLYGFAKRNHSVLDYTRDDFGQFYLRGLERVLHWNRQGVAIREVYASIVLNKILSTFDSGYVDLQSPTGAGSSVLVYNYDGYVYPSDEARMLVESGDESLRLGRIGQPLKELLSSRLQRDLINASLTHRTPGCDHCAYNKFCAPNPIDSQAQFGTLCAPVLLTDHCRRHMWFFDTFFVLLRKADNELLDLFYRWATPTAFENL